MRRSEDSSRINRVMWVRTILIVVALSPLLMHRRYANVFFEIPSWADPSRRPLSTGTTQGGAQGPWRPG
jgi:hypothetical protein